MVKRTVVVFDIIVFKNFFCLVAKNTDTGQYCKIEIGNGKNDIDLLYKLFEDNKFIFVTYNGIHFTIAIVNYILAIKDFVKKNSFISLESFISDEAKVIIEKPFEEWSEYKYAKNFSYIDLITMLFSEKKRIGFDEMKILCGVNDISSIRGNYKQSVRISEMKPIAKSCKSNVDAIEFIVNKCLDQINFRVHVSDLIRSDVLSKDNINIGVEILKNGYLRATKKKWDDIKLVKSPCDIIYLERILLPIDFKFKVLKDLYESLKSAIVVNKKKAFEKKFLLNGLEVTFSSGGCHSVNKGDIIEPNNDEILLDSDSDSFYGSIIARYKMYPPHLEKEFGEMYENILSQRLEAKAIDENSTDSLVLKQALAGAVGNYNNEHSWMYSPETAMQVRINGQLLILKLAEMLIDAGCRIVAINTDGITYIANKSIDYNKIINQWKNSTGLTLTTKQYKKIWQLDINNYIALDINDNIKSRGIFLNEFEFGKKTKMNIIAIAVINYFVYKTPIKDTICNSKNILDFIDYCKVESKYTVVASDEIINNISRFYYSKLTNNSGYICKYIDKNGEMKDFKRVIDKPVIVINRLPDEFPNDIDYNYYILQAQKIVDQFEIKQLSLFNFM